MVSSDRHYQVKPKCQLDYHRIRLHVRKGPIEWRLHGLRQRN